MRTGVILAATFLTVLGCSGSTGTSDGGPPHQNKTLVEISGQVSYDPVELQWRGLSPTYTQTEACTEVADADGGVGPPPCLEGSTVYIEDAIRALNNLCPLDTQLIHYDGKFDLMNVDVTNTTLALVASVRDALYPEPPACTGTETDSMPPLSSPIAFSGYGLGKPKFYFGGTAPGPSYLTNTQNLPVYIVSAAFVEQLAKAVLASGDPAVAGSDPNALMLQGIVIAHITKADGVTGVPGVQFEQVNGTAPNQNFPPETNGVYYISDDLQSSVSTAQNMNAVTTSSGLIVRLNAGNAAEYTGAFPSNPGHGFEQHLNGSRPGTALEVFFKCCNSTTQEGCETTPTPVTGCEPN
jgi:hypothetical protein